MKKSFAAALVVIAAAAPTVASAQFSLPSIGGSKSGGSAPAADLSGQQDALVRNFVAANKEVLTANSKLAGALGLKAQATNAEQTAGQLGDGATKGNLEDSNKVVGDTSGAIKEALAKKPVLDAEAKAAYAVGLGHLVNGTVKYAGLGKDVSNMGNSMKSANPMALAKLGSAAYVVSKFPGSASDLFNTLKVAIDFARDQGIQVPPDANAALDAVKAI
jgi:hypothetical protein